MTQVKSNDNENQDREQINVKKENKETIKSKDTQKWEIHRWH